MRDSLLQRNRRYFVTPERTGRLSAQDTLHIARARASEDGYDPQLLQQISSEAKDGEIRWYSSEPAIGCVLIVEVAGASGEIIFIGRQGLR